MAKLKTLSMMANPWIRGLLFAATGAIVTTGALWWTGMLDTTGLGETPDINAVNPNDTCKKAGEVKQGDTAKVERNGQVSYVINYYKCVQTEIKYKKVEKQCQVSRKKSCKNVIVDDNGRPGVPVLRWKFDHSVPKPSKLPVCAYKGRNYKAGADIDVEVSTQGTQVVLTYVSCDNAGNLQYRSVNQ